jgi:hypothetical protein
MSADEEPEDDFSDDDDDEFDEDDYEEDGSDLFEVTREPRTICQLCGGAGFIASPVMAVIGGTPRTIDNGRPCPHCDGNRTFTGLIPPV